MAIKVCLGGTFNVIHEGHLALLSRAFEEGDEIFIGLTSDSMAAEWRSVAVQNYETREKNLSNALSKISKGKRFWIFRIDDERGGATTENYDVIVVSSETLKGAEKINKTRVLAGLKPLRIAIIDIVLGPDGKKISSTSIIKGKN